MGYSTNDQNHMGKLIQQIFTKKSKLFLLFIAAFGFIMYALTLRGNFWSYKNINSLKPLAELSEPLESSHERANFSQTISIIENKRLDFNQDLADFSTPDVGFLKGRFVSYFPPGVSFLITPLYVLGKNFNTSQLLAFATIPFLSIFSLIFLFLISKNVFKFSRWLSLFIVFIYAFSTTSWSYSITIYQHAATVFLLLSSFYFVWKYKNSTKDGLFFTALIWALYGVSVLFDYPNPILLLGVMIYFFICSVKNTRKNTGFKLSLDMNLIKGVFVFVVLIIAFALYNLKAYGNWKTLANNLPRYEIKNIEKLKVATPSEKTSQAKLARTFQEDRIVHGFYELIAAPDKGIFIFSPILLLSIFGFFDWLRKINLERAIVIVTVAVNFFLYASFSDPWGGWAFGPRYLIPSMPFLAILVGQAISGAKRRTMAKILAFILFVFSAGVALLGALTTNLVPPKVEADYFHIKYNFLLNWDYLLRGKSGSFVFNEYFSRFMSLTGYYFLLLVPLVLLASFILFILPKYEKSN